MSKSLCIPVQELSQVGQARREAQSFCASISRDETFGGRVALVVTEFARNLVLHAGGGKLLLRESSDDTGVEILSIDRGPGMRNVGECLRDGYSTAGTPGTGLGAIRRLSDFFDLSTTQGKGTVICARLFASKERGLPQWDLGAVNVPISGETVCGDGWAVRETGDALRLVVADGLGHGIYAAEAAQEAITVFLANLERAPNEVLRLMDRALTKTRGAAVAVVEIRPSTSLVTVAGAGNISVRIFDADGKSRQIASVNGTVGTNLQKFPEFTGQWTPRSLLMMHSDGITSHWDLSDCAGLLQRHPAIVTGAVYRDYARGRDDATIVTVSHHR